MLYPISISIAPGIHLFGFIDEQGNIAVRPTYKSTAQFSEGKAAVLNEAGALGFIDLSGQISIPFRFYGLSRFVGGVCALNGGVIDHSGDWLVAPRFGVNSDFSEGRAFASFNGETFGYIRYDGEFAIQPRFRSPGPYSEGLAAVSEGDRFGYIDHQGLVVIPFVFEGRPRAFRSNRAGVRIDGMWGIIDTEGRFVNSPKYEDIRVYTEGRALVSRDRKWGMIDTEGRMAVDCHFDRLGALNGGLAPASLDGMFGFISADGQWAIEPVFDDAYGFIGPLAVVVRSTRYSYIRRDGRAVWTSEPDAERPRPAAPFLY